jgi:hypothetical protein
VRDSRRAFWMKITPNHLLCVCMKLSGS